MRRAPLRATARAASLGLSLALAAQPGCGFAQRAARSAAEGAVGTVARKVGDREGLKQLTEGMTRRSVGGVVNELGQRERLHDLQRIAGAMAAGTIAGAATAAAGGPEALGGASEPRGREARRATPVEAMTQQAAGALSRQVVAALGRTGEGPLAESLSATTEQVTEAMARGARGEVAPLFPECRGADPSQCLDRAVARVSRATAAGVAAGIGEAVGIWPVVLAFGGGATLMLVLGWAWGIYRARRPTPAS